VNRIPEQAEKEESPQDFAGRILGRLANQEGRVLVKLPAGMDREAYLGFKTFLRSEGKVSAGNCAACHAPANFTDLKMHLVTKGGEPKPTLSLRNLKQRKVDVRKAILAKIAASEAKRSGKAKGIDAEYGRMHLSKTDVPRLVAFLNLLNDVPDKEFRNLILEVTILDTSADLK
jgi:mono/diheme cytochrome c family protein